MTGGPGRADSFKKPRPKTKTRSSENGSQSLEL
jgi:hypothetical protein